MKLIPYEEFDDLVTRAKVEKERLDAMKPDGAFPAASLTSWMNIAAKAGVEAVPAYKIGDLSVELLCAIYDALPGDLQPDRRTEFDALSAAIKDAEDQGYFIRADMCSGMECKSMMGGGEYPARPRWCWDDPRIFDLISEDGRPAVPILARPWLTDLMTVPVKLDNPPGHTIKDGIRRYPVEFRVFFGGHAEDDAVSAYYPQAAPLARAFTPYALQARDLAGQMMRICTEEGLLPWMLPYPRYDIDPNALHCTLDFVMTNAGRMLFLEGGPAHFENWGAHPCCFEGRAVSGVAGISEQTA